MCGVVALVRREEIARQVIEGLTDMLAHRGPDAGGVELLSERRVALGNRRLAILDLSSAGRQPMCDASGRVWITYNGEIFNYLELREELRGEGYLFRSGSDTEVLLALYRRDGMRMLRQLRGMYAFVLHDTESGETFYARDPIGIKPLYVRSLPDGVAFASEPAVLRGLGLSTLDVLPIVRSLMFLYPPGEEFGIREIRRVPPGQVGRVTTDGKITPLPFGPILPDGRGPGRYDLRPGVEELEAELRAAVREHLTSDVPVGVAFSGGIDSSTVAKLASQEMTKPVRLYSFLPRERTRGERLDDARLMQAAALSLGLDLSIVETPTRLLDDLGTVVRAVGEPVADPAAIAFLNIAKRARQEGRYVLLSGHGADELMAGYRRHLAAAVLLPYPALARAIGSLPGLPIGDLRRLTEVFREPRPFWLPLLQSVVRPSSLRTLLSPDVLPAGLDAVLEPLVRVASKSVGALPLRRSMHLDFDTYLVDQNLNYLDKVSMAHGVEGRVPYLTPPVLSICASLPPADLVRGVRGKVALRRVATRLLPAELGRRPKRGFGIPLRYMVSREWEAIRDRLTESSARSRFLWSPGLLDRLARAHRPPVSPSLVYTMLVIDHWLADWRLP